MSISSASTSDSTAIRSTFCTALWTKSLAVVQRQPHFMSQVQMIFLQRIPRMGAFQTAIIRAIFFDPPTICPPSAADSLSRVRPFWTVLPCPNIYRSLREIFVKQLLNWKFLDFKHRARTSTHIFTIKVCAKLRPCQRFTKTIRFNPNPTSHHSPTRIQARKVGAYCVIRCPTMFGIVVAMFGTNMVKIIRPPDRTKFTIKYAS